MKNKAAAPAEEPPTKRTKLFDEDAQSDDEAVNLTINEDFAKRFEHNKKREEKQRRISHHSVYILGLPSNTI
jgi:protein KRI1